MIRNMADAGIHGVDMRVLYLFFFSRQGFISTAHASQSLSVRRKVLDGIRTQRFRSLLLTPFRDGNTTRNKGVLASLPSTS